MADLLEKQFELEGVVFGRACPVEVEKFGPTPGTWRTQDKERARGNGVNFGRDYRGAGTWAFDLYTNGEDVHDAQAAAEQLAMAWPTDELVATPRAVTPLRYRIGGRTRRVYGRPRRWSAPPETVIDQGLLKITADFTVGDPLIYDDAEESRTFTLAAADPVGGVRSPVRSPVLSRYTPSRVTEKAITVGGTVPTWATVEFQYGMTNPWIEVAPSEPDPVTGKVKFAGWHAQVLTTLLQNDLITMDARPWVRSTVRESGTVAISRETRLLNMILPPGKHRVRLGSDDGSSTGAITVRWRNAYREL